MAAVSRPARLSALVGILLQDKVLRGQVCRRIAWLADPRRGHSRCRAGSPPALRRARRALAPRPYGRRRGPDAARRALGRSRAPARRTPPWRAALRAHPCVTAQPPPTLATSAAGSTSIGASAESRRVGGHVAEVAHDPRATVAVDALALLPVREHRGGDEDRRVGTRGDPYEQSRRRSPSAWPRRTGASRHGQQRAEARGQRSSQDLGHRAVDDL